ncbi:MAG: sulfurtransferase TusA family protein [Lachnospiraceae bacterium]|nr:sulfurtransferase TusA family protein [Lachnospiraceae bacterium]
MIDARGRSCPEPVIMLRKALESKEDHYEIMVDNHVSVENVTRFAEHSGYEVHIEEKGDDFLLTLTR